MKCIVWTEDFIVGTVFTEGDGCSRVFIILQLKPVCYKMRFCDTPTKNCFFCLRFCDTPTKTWEHPCRQENPCGSKECGWQSQPGKHTNNTEQDR